MRLTRKICNKHGYHLIDEGGSGNELVVGMGCESMGQAFDGLNDHESSPLQGCMLNLREQAEEAGYRLGGPAFGFKQRLVDALRQRCFLEQDVLQTWLSRVHLRHSRHIVV